MKLAFAFLSLVSSAALAHNPGDPPHQQHCMGELKLEGGQAIRDFCISYVTHGTLNAAKSNAILMVTAISGNHHRIDYLIGPGRALDPSLFSPRAMLAEQRWVERAPVAAMDEQRERRRDIGARRKQIDELARRRSVTQSKLGTPLLHGFGAIVLGLARPACEDFRVFGHAGAVVVFGFVVDGHGISPCSPLYHLFPPAGRGRGEGRKSRAPVPTSPENAICLAL